MNVLIFYVHPNLKNLNRDILDQVKHGLTDGKHNFVERLGNAK